jgi:hypothetical protein
MKMPQQRFIETGNNIGMCKRELGAWTGTNRLVHDYEISDIAGHAVTMVLCGGASVGCNCQAHSDTHMAKKCVALLELILTCYCLVVALVRPEQRQ